MPPKFIERLRGPERPTIPDAALKYLRETYFRSMAESRGEVAGRYPEEEDLSSLMNFLIENESPKSVELASKAVAYYIGIEFRYTAHPTPDFEIVAPETLDADEIYILMRIGEIIESGVKIEEWLSKRRNEIQHHPDEQFSPELVAVNVVRNLHYNFSISDDGLIRVARILQSLGSYSQK